MENVLIEDICRNLKEVWERENSFHELRKYIEIDLGFTYIGRGSSRVVYSFGESLVLKLAINRQGTAQNETECKIFGEVGSKLPILNDIVSYDDKYFIYEVQKYAKKINDKKLNKLVRVDWYEIEDAILGIDKYPSMSASEAIKFYTNIEEGDRGYETVYNILDASHVLKSEYKIELGDMTKPNSYGTNDSGELKLLDYGMSSDTWNKFYKDKQ